MAPFTYAALSSIILQKIDNPLRSSTTNWGLSSSGSYKYKPPLSALSLLWFLSGYLLFTADPRQSYDMLSIQRSRLPLHGVRNVWINPFATPRYDPHVCHLFLILFYSNKTMTFGQQTTGLQDGISHTGKEESHGCQTKGVAKLESDAGFYP